jgi:hypothetical protein
MIADAQVMVGVRFLPAATRSANRSIPARRQRETGQEELPERVPRGCAYIALVVFE